MKALAFAYFLCVTLMVSMTSGRNLFPRTLEIPRNPSGFTRDNKRESLRPILQSHQSNPNLVMPPKFPGNTGAGNDGSVTLSDMLSKTRAINIFASLTRDIKSVSDRLSNGSENTTVLAPSNSALQRLPRKPWENPDDYERFGQEQAYAGSQGKDRAAENLKRFVEAHVVPQSPWDQGEEVESLGGGKIRWEKGENGKIYVSETKHIFPNVCV